MRCGKSSRLVLAGVTSLSLLSACESEESSADEPMSSGPASEPQDTGSPISPSSEPDDPGDGYLPPLLGRPDPAHIDIELPDAPAKPDGACELDDLGGYLAIRSRTDVISHGKSLDSQGGQLDSGSLPTRMDVDSFLLQYMEDDGNGTLSGWQQLCWLTGPDSAHSALSVEETWGSDFSLIQYEESERVERTATYNCRHAGCTTLSEPQSNIIGLDISAETEWPMEVAMTDPTTWTDADGDGQVGITVGAILEGESERWGSPYSGFPLSSTPTSNWVRASELYIASRTDTYFVSTVMGDDCQTSEATSEVTFAHDLVLGCRVLEGTGEPPDGPAPKGGQDCNDTQIAYIDSARAPSYRPYLGEELPAVVAADLEAEGLDAGPGKGTRITSFRFEGDGERTCADVRAHFGIE